MNNTIWLSFLAASLILFAGVSFSAGEEWPHLVTTFGLIPGFGVSFDSQPRTEAELVDDGWIAISDCSNNNPSFLGKRWVRSEKDGDRDMVIITDVNGFIAGIQSVVLRSATNGDAFFDFTNSPWYVLDQWVNGEEAFFTTAYFVDPDTICEGGRSEDDFQVQGTGYRLSFQSGPDPLTDLMRIPTAKSEMLATNEIWSEHYCFVNMGEHFFSFPASADDNAATDGSFDCNAGVMPFQIVYEDGLLNGFIFQHLADMASISRRYESVSAGAARAIINDPPQCILDATESPGVSTMHVWMSTYLTLCL